MRDEMLKRLDALIDEINKMRAAPFQFGLLGWDERWLALRDELAAERRENCQLYRGDADEVDPPNNACDLYYFALKVDPAFFCARFERKVDL